MTTQRAYTRYQNGMNEGGEGYNPHADALTAEQARDDAAAVAAWDKKMTAERLTEEAEWTRDVTIQRRADWNTWVRSTQAQGKALRALATQRVATQGWSLTALQAQIKRHGLL